MLLLPSFNIFDKINDYNNKITQWNVLFVDHLELY